MAGKKTLGFRRHIQAYIVDDDKLLLRGNSNTHILNNAVYKALAPLLDGTRTDDEIVAELLDDYPAENLYYALLSLQSKGHVVEFDGALPDNEIAFWHGAGMDVSDVIERRHSRKLAITSLTDLSERALLETKLVDNGITLTEPDNACLIVVLTDDYLNLDAVAETRFDSGIPWLPVGLSNHLTWVGPLFTTHDI